MAGGSGIYAQLGMAPESTMGTAVTPTRFFEFNSETLSLGLTRVVGQGLHNGGLYPRIARSQQTTRDVNGGFNLNVPNKGLGMLLQHMVGSFGQTLAAATIISGTSYKQVHVPGTIQGHTFTLQKGVSQTSDGTVKPFTYVGSKITGWTLACQTGAIATLDVTMDAWDELTLVTSPPSPALATASYPATAGEFTFVHGTVYVGGTAATSAGLTTLTGATALAAVTGASIQGTTGMKTDRFFFGSSGRKSEPLENALRTVTGSLDMEFYNQADIYDLYRADTTTALELKFVGPVISGANNFTLDVLIPAVKFEGQTPQVGGPDISMASAPFTGGEDTLGNPALQITYISSDATT